jgi:hypothetical protein
MAENKGKYNKLSKAAYEKKMQNFADSLKRETERLTAKQRKSWDGKIKDVPSADVKETKVDKKEKK